MKTLNNKGITIMELLVTIVILGIIGSISTPVIGKSLENMQKDQIIEDSMHIERAAENFCLRPENVCPIGEDVPMEKLIDYIDGYDEIYTINVKRLSERSFGIYYAAEDEYSFPFNEEGLLVSRELSADAATRDLVNIPSGSETVPEQDFEDEDSPEQEEPTFDFPKWEEGTHSVGDRVQYDGKVFEIIGEGAIWSAPEPETLSPWDGFQEVEIGNEFRVYNRYDIGEKVTYQGSTYEATWEDYGSSGYIPSESLAWQELTMQYTPYNEYNKGDSVIHNGDTYIAIDNWVQEKEPGTESSMGNWNNISSDAWYPYNTYNHGDTVEYNGKTYEALDNWVQNDNPETSNRWSEVIEDNEAVRWNKNNLYSTGTLVIHGNTVYEALKDTEGGKPPHKNSGVWQPVD